MQGISSWLWGFNPLLLRLHREISLSLVCSHSSWGSALDLASPLHVGCPLASVLHPDRRGLKERLIRGLGLTQVGGREGYGIRGKPAAAEASMTLQKPEACRVFSRGTCPWIMGPWQWRAATGTQEGRCGYWPVLSHRILGGCSSSLSISCPSLVSTLISAARACLWSSFMWCSESSLLTHPKTMVSWPLGSFRLLPG